MEIKFYLIFQLNKFMKQYCEKNIVMASFVNYDHIQQQKIHRKEDFYQL